MNKYKNSFKKILFVVNYEFEVKCDIYNMADPGWQMKFLNNQANQGKFHIEVFFWVADCESQVIFSKFWNPRWRIQDGGKKCSISSKSSFQYQGSQKVSKNIGIYKKCI